MTAIITSAQLLELSANATGGNWMPAKYASSIVGRPIVASPSGRSIGQLTQWHDESEANGQIIAALCSEPARNRIAKALDLLERVEAGDEAEIPALRARAEKAEAEVQSAETEIARLRGIVLRQTIALQAIADPEPHEPADAVVCAAIARSALNPAIEKETEK